MPPQHPGMQMAGSSSLRCHPIPTKSTSKRRLSASTIVPGVRNCDSHLCRHRTQFSLSGDCSPSQVGAKKLYGTSWGAQSRCGGCSVLRRISRRRSNPGRSTSPPCHHWSIGSPSSVTVHMNRRGFAQRFRVPATGGVPAKASLFDRDKANARHAASHGVPLRYRLGHAELRIRPTFSRRLRHHRS